ncbi:hypothetical protein ABZ642_07005 [Streptomyces sp. NPDC007157]|uniref:hypothetical protein n=1 Tax=Streptomyces sp. NPDC007157 TaxID=3154681 RepID=UPI003411372F
MRQRTRGTTAAQRVLTAEVALVGALCVALLVTEIPSLLRELKIWRISGGLGAGHRYP